MFCPSIYVLKVSSVHLKFPPSISSFVSPSTGKVDSSVTKRQLSQSISLSRVKVSAHRSTRNLRTAGWSLRSMSSSRSTKFLRRLFVVPSFKVDIFVISTVSSPPFLGASIHFDCTARLRCGGDARLARLPVPARSSHPDKCSS